MVYELWDVSTRNLVGSFASEDEALAAVREDVSTLGKYAADDLMLAHEDDQGHTTALAAGGALVERALQRRTA